MILSRAELEQLMSLAEARAKRVDALRAAIKAKDYRRAIELARAVCGMEPDDEPQPDRSDPPLDR
jgi:hypothetical protein